MNAQVNIIDSEAAGGNVIEVDGFSGAEDFPAFERQVIHPLAPRFAFIKVPAEDVASVRRLEDVGYRFAELQLTLRCRLRQSYDVSRYPYRFELVTSDEDLQAALALAGSIFTHDRFSADPDFGPAVSGRRFQAYVRKSFHASDERLYVMKNNATGQVVSFGTLRLIKQSEVRLLIGGVANEFKLSGLGTIHDYVGLNTYYADGIRVVHTCVSAVNYPIMNLEIAHLGFKVTGGQVVLKKRYK